MKAFKWAEAIPLKATAFVLFLLLLQMHDAQKSYSYLNWARWNHVHEFKYKRNLRACFLPFVHQFSLDQPFQATYKIILTFFSSFVHTHAYTSAKHSHSVCASISFAQVIQNNYVEASNKYMLVKKKKIWQALVVGEYVFYFISCWLKFLGEKERAQSSWSLTPLSP